MRRRRRKRAAELTALIDVLFILLFAALIQARGAGSAEPVPVAPARVDAGAADASVPDAPAADVAPADAAPADAAPLRTHIDQARELAMTVARAVRGQPVYIAEVGARGELLVITRFVDGREGRRDLMQQPLVRVVPPAESDQELSYIGQEDPGQMVCSLVRARMVPGAPHLDQALIIVITAEPVESMPMVLYDGLKKEAAECFTRQRGSLFIMSPGEAMEKNDETR